jgi:multidrug efflux system membrane fusion protein
VTVRARVDGELNKVLFQEGQDVEAGDVLAQVDPRPYEAQLAQQIANRAKHQALLDNALLNLNRYGNLVNRDFISRQLYDTQTAEVTGVRAQLLDDEAAINYARTQLEYATIKSPIPGRVGIRQVDQGNFVRAAENTTIVVVTQLRPISVVFALPANATAQSGLLPGRSDIAVMAYSSDDTTKLDEGRVELVDNQVDSSTGTIKVKATFPNRDLRLWPGDFVNGRLVVDTKKGGLTIPEAALRHGPLGDFVWIVRSDMTALSRRVQVVQASNGQILLGSGVARGERVITDGYFRLEDGVPVEIVKAGARPAKR